MGRPPQLRARSANNWCASALAALLLAGCATAPTPSAQVPVLAPVQAPAPAPAPANTNPAVLSQLYERPNQVPSAAKPLPGPLLDPATAPRPLTIIGPVPVPAPARPATLAREVVATPVAPRTLDLTAPAEDVWTRIRNGFAIPNLISPLVVERQAWYLAKPEYFLRTVDRSSIYLYHIVQELEKRGMPTELALLPFIESAYNPMALSTSRASGMWQFIPSTGRQYNLKQDWWRDERRDILASTEAALTYLQTIYEMHGDWHLALASYNWGEGAVKRAIEKNKALGLPTDYLNLTMPDETRYYIPKLQAVKNILAHPELFNIVLPKINNQPYFATVTKKRDIDIRTAARLAEIPVEDFKALNPSFNRALMLGSGTILLPADKATIFETNLAAHGSSLTTWRPYTMQRNDRIDKVAKKFGMTVSNLREINGLGPTVKIKPGQVLLVRAGGGAAGPTGSAVEPPAKVAAAPAARTVPATAKTTSYVVRRGDTLFGIAKKFGLALDAIKSLNGLKHNRVSVGQLLKLPQ